jgi:hypothetical protein
MGLTEELTILVLQPLILVGGHRVARNWEEHETGLSLSPSILQSQANLSLFSLRIQKPLLELCKTPASSYTMVLEAVEYHHFLQSTSAASIHIYATQHDENQATQSDKMHWMTHTLPPLPRCIVLINK